MDRQAIETRALTRRGFTRRLGALGLTAFGLNLAGAPATRHRAEAASALDLVYFTFGGQEDPRLFSAFVEKYGQAPNISFYVDEYEAIEKMRAGYEADVVTPCIDVMPRWRDGAGLRPLDEARLVHLNDMFDVIANAEAARFGGQRFYIPMYFGWMTVLYRPDLTDITPDRVSWKLFYDERFKNKIAMWDSTDAVIPCASLALGYTDNPFAPAGERLDRVAELMRTQRNLVRLYWTDPAQMLQAFVAGEIVLAFAWSTTLAQLHETGVPFAVVAPKEGILTFSCGLARGNGSADEDLVYDFINASTSPEAGKARLELFATGSANRKAFGLVAPESLEAAGLTDPETVLRSGHVYRTVPPELKAQHIDLFDKIKAGF